MIDTVKTQEDKKPRRFSDQLLALMKKYAKEDPNNYINPNFLTVISGALYDYYQLEDEEVDNWIRNMWEM